jgi:tetratricopeptide (TPR) repeat protein
MMNREYAMKADSLGRKILAEKGSYSTGIELFMRSATIYKRLGGETDPDYSNAMALLAKCYMRNDQLQDAINVLCLLSDIYKKNEPASEQHAIILDNLSLYYAMADNPSMALEKSKEVMRICDQIELSKQDLLYVLVHAAENYATMKEYTEAIRIQLRALDIAHQLYGRGSEKYIGELQYLQQYYEGAGDKNKAKKTAETIDELEKPGGGLRSADELKTAEDCAYHRGDAYWCAEYFINHKVSADNALDAGDYATAWCMSTDELTLEIDECHAKCLEDSPTELTAYICACLIIGQSCEVKKLTREMERLAMQWTVKHYQFNRDILVNKSSELDKLVEYLENDTLEEKLKEIIPDKESDE